MTRLRLELPQQFLHVQSIGLVTADGVDAAAGAEVTASSWYGSYGEQFDAARLFDWEHPAGTVVHTQKDDPSWVEVRFARPVRLTEVLLRNVAKDTATRAAGLKVVVRTRWRAHVVFDGRARHAQLKAAVTGHDLGDAGADVEALLPRAPGHGPRRLPRREGQAPRRRPRP